MSDKDKLNKLDKLYSDFKEQEKESLKESLIPYLEGFFNYPCRCRAAMNYQKSETDVFLSIVNGMPSLRKKFWDREVMSNMSTLITVPFIFREDKNLFMASAYRKKSNSKLKVTLTHVFGYYNHQTKQFMWNPRELYPLEMMRQYHDNIFHDLDILNHNLIENITSEQSYKIAYFYRLLYYACRLSYFFTNISKEMNNENLVIHEVICPKGGKKDYYTIFSLMDLGVKEPPLNKNTLEDLEFELRLPFYSYKNIKKNKSPRLKKSLHRSTMKVLPKDKKKSTQKNLFQKIKSFIFK